MFARVLPSLAVLGLLAVPLSAQTAAERAVLDRFRDSIAVVPDSAPLLRLEGVMIQRAKANREDPLAHLRLGFLALRLGDIAGKQHYDDAASEFQWAIDLRPRWPYAWYGMGLAELGVGNSQIAFLAGLQTMLGKDALSRSAMAFAKSAEVDPSFVHGLVELAGTALRQRVNIKLNVALDALRRAGATPAGDHPDVLLARGRVEREVGDPDSALAAVRRLLERRPESGLARLEVARTFFQTGSLEGVPLYYAGAADDDPDAVAAYRADLVVIAPDSTLRAFDAARGAARETFLRRFWGERDRMSLRTDGERLREHYRRLAYARRNFLLAGMARHYRIEERFRSGNPDFDDRGVIYIRHGEPSERAMLPAAAGVEPNESWRYSRPDGDLLFHFVAREDVQDYKLVESVFDVLGFSDAVMLRDRGGLDANAEALELLRSRDRLSPIYGRIMGAGSVSSGQFQGQERRIGQESIALGTRTDSYELHYARPLKAQVNVLAVGRDGDRPEVQIAYALSGDGLTAAPSDRGPTYAVRLRFVAADAAGRVVAALDTTRRFVAASAVPPGEHLVGRVSLPVLPGVLTYRVALEQGPEAGVVLPRDSVRVDPPATAAAPTLSDLVLGAERINLVWRPRETDTVYFNPLRTFLAGDPMQVYYEVRGLAPGVKYTTQVVVKKGSGRGAFRKMFEGGGKALSLKFEDRATGPETAVQRTLALSRLRPGTYVLGVAITDERGRTGWREAEFQVVKEK